MNVNLDQQHLNVECDGNLMWWFFVVFFRRKKFLFLVWSCNVNFLIKPIVLMFHLNQ